MEGRKGGWVGGWERCVSEAVVSRELLVYGGGRGGGGGGAEAFAAAGG